MGARMSMLLAKAKNSTEGEEEHVRLESNVQHASTTGKI
jgi:hypothetical protein